MVVETRRQRAAAESDIDSDVPDPKQIPISRDAALADTPRSPKTKTVKSSSKKRNDDEDDSSSNFSISVLDVLRVLLGAIALSCMMSYFIIGDSYIWGQDKLVRKYYRQAAMKYWVKPVYMDETTLSLYNGSDPNLPIYLSINQTIYDVSAAPKKYGPGGSYWFFSGRDASRAYITGDFKNDLTWDYSGLPEEKIKRSLGHWVNFFANHEIYTFVGYLIPGPSPLQNDPPEPEPPKDEL